MKFDLLLITAVWRVNKGSDTTDNKCLQLGYEHNDIVIIILTQTSPFHFIGTQHCVIGKTDVLKPAKSL